MYLTYRFHITNEFSNVSPDMWLDNSNWFDVKLLVDCFGCEFSKTMCGDSYSGAVKSVLNKLKIPATSLVHIGRKLGPKLLEMLDEESSWIKLLRNWDPSIQQTSYSTKLPMRPIRKLAGFTKANGMYYNPRCAVQVPLDLQKKTPIGCWAIDALSSLQETVGGHSKYTALNFLNLMVELNKVVIQDVAAMIVTCPQRISHSIFELGCFQDDNFKVRFFLFFYFLFYLLLSILGLTFCIHFFHHAGFCRPHEDSAGWG